MIIIILIALCTIVFGGMDFTHMAPQDNAMTSEEFYKDYKIPTFLNKQEATIWVYKTKYVEPIRRLLIRRIKELHVLADPHVGNIDPNELRIVSNLMAQVEDCEEALKIMTDFKNNHVDGKYDEAMSTLYTVPTFVNEKYAIAWAHEIKWDEPILLAVARKKAVLQGLIRQQTFESPEHTKQMESWIGQWRMLDEAHKIMWMYKDQGIKRWRDYGASVYVGSEPIK